VPRQLVGDTVTDRTCTHFVEGPLPFISLRSEPASFAQAWLGYVAPERMQGTANIRSLIQQLARRFAIEHQLAEDIARELRILSCARGAAVRIIALHVGRRVAVESNRQVVAWNGIYLDKPELQADFLRRSVRRAS
jgi:GTP cyclohydrolase I